MFLKEEVRAYGAYDVDAVSDESAHVNNDPSMTVQSQAAEADINTIVRNFGLTGKMPENVRAPSYGDFTGVDDYASALKAIQDADVSFMSMPADVRSRFENDPQRFLEFCETPGNRDELVKLGLIVPIVPEVAPVVTPAS